MYMYLCTYIYTHYIHTIYVYLYTYIYVYVCTRLYIYILIHICIHICTRIQPIHRCAQVYTHINIHHPYSKAFSPLIICPHACTHVHTYTHCHRDLTHDRVHLFSRHFLWRTRLLPHHRGTHRAFFDLFSP